MFLFLGAFVAGILTVLAPCVLALLPIIIGGSFTGDNKDRKRPVIIAISLAVSLIVFTLLLKATTLLINIPPRSISIGSGIIIIIIGILMIFPLLYARIIGKFGVEHRALGALNKGFANKNQYIGPIVTGAALGPVFSSCSPVYAYILATILPSNFAQAIALIVVYVLGLTIVLLAIGYYGQGFMSKIKFASNPKGWFQRIIAILFIVTGLLIATGYDKRFQTYVSEHTPFNFDKLSSKLLPDSKNKIDESKLFNVEPYDASELEDVQNWINSNPTTLKEQKGKVVMIDFWTYSCINCIRNNPYIEQWYQNYKDDGFVAIGVHAPEFAFEKNADNVKKAVKDQKITYPVVLDNNFTTWNKYNNRSWPASYLIDKDGKVRRIHEGEGKYAESEQAIRELLKEKGANLNDKMTTNTDGAPITEQQTPETYLGFARASNYIGLPALSGTPAVRNFMKPSDFKSNQWALSGNWETTTEKIIARGNSKLTFKVSARDVYVVGGSSSKQNIMLTLNGQPLSSTGKAGSDVMNSMVPIQESKLYRLVDFGSFAKDQTIELSVPDGVELNVFTFGS